MFYIVKSIPVSSYFSRYIYVIMLIYSQLRYLYKVIFCSIFEKTPSSLRWKEYHQYIHKYDWLYEMWNMLREGLTPCIFSLPRYWNTFLPLWLIECNIAALTNMIFEICSCSTLDINTNTMFRIPSVSRYFILNNEIFL